jgi:hypothetical protein
MGIKAGGTLWGWGFGGPDSDNRYFTSAAIGINQYDFGRFSPTQVGVATDWVQIAAAEYASAGIRGAGTLWVSGRNLNGRLGVNGDAGNPKQVGTHANWQWVAVGPNHMMARK